MPQSRFKNLLSFFSVMLLASCSKSVIGPVVPPTESKGTSYVMDATDLRVARSNEFYVLWLRATGDSLFKKAAVLSLDPHKLHNDDQIQLLGSVATKDSLIVIEEAAVSVEFDTSSIRPTSILLRGTNLSVGHFDLEAFRQGAVADLRSVSGSAVFLSSTSDTNRAHHEFYLMSVSGTATKPSLSVLPNLNHGWHYAAWYTDSSYYPAHRFFYGAFLNASGHDSDSSRDGYDYPGGYEPPALAGGTGKLEITIEPDFQLPSLAKLGPSPFPFLEGSLPKYIYNGTAIVLTNVSSRGLPRANLVLTQQ